MSTVSLKKLLGRRGSLGPVVGRLIEVLGPDIGIQDADGSWVAGAQPPGDCRRQAIVAGGQTLGWVAGAARPEELAALAELVIHAAGQEAEKRSVAAEALERYRELNLLYTLSEKLAGAPEPAAITRVALEEAARLIRAQAGLALDVVGGDYCVEPVAAFGPAYRLNEEPCAGSDLIRRVLESGQPELVDDVPGEAIFQDAGARLSLLCAPIKTEKAVLGALLLVRHRPESFAAGELKLLNTVALQAAPAVEIARLHQVAVEKARMERELQMAREVQAGLIPAHMPRMAGWQFAADWRPALEVAGDYYDVVCEADGQLSLAIADVAGKGMAASLMMVFARSVLRASADRSRPLAEGIARANRLLAQEMPSGMFITLFYARLDPHTGELTYVNAGHNPPLVYRRASDQVVHLHGTGMALGLLVDIGYEQGSIQLEPGDMALLYTDGVTEAFDAGGEQFGMDRLTRVLRRNRQASPSELVRDLEAALSDWMEAVHPSDDITLMVVKRV